MKIKQLSTYQKKLLEIANIDLTQLVGNKPEDKELKGLQTAIKRYLYHYTRIGYNLNPMEIQNGKS